MVPYNTGIAVQENTTVESQNKGHFKLGAYIAFVLFLEVVLWWEVRANMQPNIPR